MFYCPSSMQPSQLKHSAAFFNYSQELVASVVDYVVEGFSKSEKVIIIFTSEHLTAIESLLKSQLKSQNCDLAQYQNTGQYLAYNAESILPVIFENGVLKPQSVRELFKKVVSEDIHPFTGIRISGELVRILWSQGYLDATLSLENFWNEALSQHPATLYCPYLCPEISKVGPNMEHLEICKTHSSVLPAQYFGTFSDLSFLQEMVLEVERKNIRLESELCARLEYEKTLKFVLKERDDFISILGHELRTPLTSSTLQSQIIRKLLNASEGDDSIHSKMKRSLDICDFENARMKRLIENVLSNGQLENGRFILDRSYFDLSNLASNVVARYQDYYAARSTCKVQLIRGESIIGHWDQERIEQILINLISNAIKYGKNGPVEVAVGKDHPSSAFISVKDHGIGIPKAQYEAIFKKFERGYKNHRESGLGLGLFIVKKIAEAHQGTVSLESIEGVGTEFHVKLPLATLDSTLPS